MLIRLNKLEALGCPIVNGRGPCAITCGGGWDGTLMSDEALAAAVISEKIDPTKLGCGPIEERVTAALKEGEVVTMPPPIPA
jgi:hypothetical protein